MAKVVIDPITTQFGFQSALNLRLKKIEDVFNNQVLFRSTYVGEPNTMTTDLDMGDKDIINVGQISAADFKVAGQDITQGLNESVIKAQAAATSAEASKVEAGSYKDAASLSASNASTSATEAASTLTNVRAEGTIQINRIETFVDTLLPPNGTVGVAMGGTGATTASEARTNLGCLAEADLLPIIRDLRAGDVVLRGHSTIRTLSDGLPEGLELNGDIVSLTTFSRLLRVWCGDAQNATAPAFYRCDSGGVRSSAGTHIKLLDARGYVPRAWDHGRGIDAGRVLASLQEDAIRNITGTLGPLRVKSFDLTSSGTTGAFKAGTTVADSGGSGLNPGQMNFTFDASRVVPTAAENRMCNAALMFIIYV